MAADRQEQIEQQLGLLERHRTTLAHYLRQQAQLSTAHTSPGVTHGIIEARQNIQRVKQTLRAWNVAVEDHPDDEALPENTSPIDLKKSYGRPRILVVWVAIAAAMALIGVVGLVILLAANNSLIGANNTDTTATSFQGGSGATTISVVNDTAIQAVTIGQSKDTYKLQVTLYNGLDNDITMKRIRFNYSDLPAGFACGGEGGTYTISDKLLVEDTGKTLKLQGEATSNSEAFEGYTFKTEGSLNTSCRQQLDLSFSTALVIPQKSSNSFYIVIPKTLHFTKFKHIRYPEQSTSTPGTISISLDGPSCFGLRLSFTGFDDMFYTENTMEGAASRNPCES